MIQSENHILYTYLKEHSPTAEEILLTIKHKRLPNTDITHMNQTPKEITIISSVQTLTGKKFGAIGPPGIPSFGGN